MVKGFVEFLGTQLSAKTVLWDPCKKIAVQNPQFKSILEKNGPAMTVVAGLAMRSI